MIVLGVNSVFHESSAAVVRDGTVLAAAEEERFTRRKHAKSALVDNADELPVEAIRYCLREAGIAGADLDLVAYSYDPALRRELFRPDPLSVPGDWGSEAGEAQFLAGLDRVPARLADVLGSDPTGRLRWVPHHVAHAASAYYPSGFDSAGILVADGIGEAATTVLFAGEGGRLTRLDQLCYPDSLGFIWEKLSAFLGFSQYDASKVMGLAGYGDPAVYAAAFAKFFNEDGPRFAADPEVLRFRLPDVEPLRRLLGDPREGGPIEARHADIAAALQVATNRTMLRLAEHLYGLHPTSNLRLAGGVALNCTANFLVKERGPFTATYVPPAPHDAGTAVGGALHLAATESASVPSGPVTTYSGPGYADEEILDAVDAAGLSARRCPDVASEVARLIAGGAVVGWFQDRMEFGPRALGNRSLLADPRDPGMREMLNRKVKHREDFRPFAPSVLAEEAASWFELGRPSQAYATMLFTCPVRADKASRIPAVLHVDGTARVQTVDRDDNPRYHRLISAFAELSGVPMLLNTSFNDSEPIVCSPVDALHTFLGTRIDAVALGDYLVERPR
ncbi:MAG TPA: carbamoyltransferase C-terminal domain-containing protein [Mycobacteriales bacterium]|nr:carbamoyltransferase C-terminal domain-containing protein [Mycobacteriales bacterium]